MGRDHAASFSSSAEMLPDEIRSTRTAANEIRVLLGCVYDEVNGPKKSVLRTIRLLDEIAEKAGHNRDRLLAGG